MIKQLILVALAAAALGGAHAAPSSQTAAAGRVIGGGVDTGWNPQTGADTAPTQATQAALLTNGSAFGWASSGPGYAKALAEAHLSGAGEATGFASGSYNDTIRLSAAGLRGQSGRLTAVFLLDYELIATAPGATPYLHFSASIGRSGAQLVLQGGNHGGAQYLGGFYEVNDALGYSMLRDTPVTAVALSSDFVWGEDINIGYRMLVQASATANGAQSTSAISDAAHSAYWGGFVFIESNGQTVKDFTVSADSGANYAASFAPASPVPEPGTTGMLLAGACVVAARLRRRRVLGD